jgi:hypothetical protein
MALLVYLLHWFQALLLLARLVNFQILLALGLALVQLQVLRLLVQRVHLQTSQALQSQ